MAALGATDRAMHQTQATQDHVAFVSGASLDPCGRPKAAPPCEAAASAALGPTAIPAIGSKGARPCRIVSVVRFSLAILCGLLMLSLSGVTVIAIGEPCTGVEQTDSDHNSCPPTCVTCGCCAQAVEPAAVHVDASQKPSPGEPPPVVDQLPAASPFDVLHVPKPFRS
jgi:hypothetical protein